MAKGIGGELIQAMSEALDHAKGKRTGSRLKLTKWDPVDYLTNEARIVAYIDAALEDGDPQLIAAALGDVAKVRGMSVVAEKVGMSRTSLSRALSADSRAEFSTIIKVMNVLGVRMRADSARPQKTAKRAGRASPKKAA